MLTYHTRRILDSSAFLALFDKVRHIGRRGQVDQYEAYCPGHKTSHRSLAIGLKSDGSYLVHCQAGCSSASILEAVGLSLRDLYPDGFIAERLRPLNVKKSKDEWITDIGEDTRKAGRKLTEQEKELERRAWLRRRQSQDWPPRQSSE